MKKTIAMLLAVLMLASLFTGCAKNETEIPEEVPVVDPAAGNEPAAMPGADDEPAVMPEVTPENDMPTVTPEVDAPAETPEVDAPAETPEEAPELETPILPPAGSSAIAMDLSAIVDEMYKIYDPILPAGTIPVDLADEFSRTSYTGLADASLVKEAIASESMIGAQAYSVVLVRLNNAADAQAVAEAMRNGIDQRKWICVMADDIRVVAAGDVVMLCMIDSTLDVKVDTMVEAFGKVVGVPFSVDIK